MQPLTNFFQQADIGSILYVVKTHETKVFLLEKVGQLTPGQIKTQKLDVV